MNISNFIHVACALAVQAAIGLLTDNWWAGAAAAAVMFVAGRAGLLPVSSECPSKRGYSG